MTRAWDHCGQGKPASTQSNNGGSGAGGSETFELEALEGPSPLPPRPKASSSGWRGRMPCPQPGISAWPEPQHLGWVTHITCALPVFLELIKHCPNSGGEEACVCSCLCPESLTPHASVTFSSVLKCCLRMVFPAHTIQSKTADPPPPPAPLRPSHTAYHNPTLYHIPMY